MSLDTKLTLLARALGTDVKSLTAAVGNPAALTTTAKNSLVAAINEVQAALQSTTVINDTSASTTSTYSSSKMTDLLAQLKSDILGGASAAYDTLKEIETKLGSDDTALANLLSAVGNRVSFADAQSLTAAQQLQACQNIGIGDPTVDLVAAYNAAKA
ncbi:hypothetical protein [Paludibacterium denitrificans]|uniref:Uncharacterized protein n=1 Tax=Paludibacterium denitrificans TaxID=2675226 RepID=A0A844GEC3_9NEIS|nr:hypothetical protein [Paludibacterium denitrificans]MTD33670.1 hypothetical protein [Paludibacterium denitrificans]